jgi:formamidopyrimidine-DNA glycosylase
MPELPEVETIKNELSPWVLGQSFTNAIIFDSDLLFKTPVEEFRHNLIDQTILTIERRGKYLIFRLASKQGLIMHFRMTGTLLLNPKDTDRYARAAFYLTNGNKFIFIDRRRLGILWLAADADAAVARLGPEPLGASFTPGLLEQRLSHHHIPIKAALLDQGIIAGIGNMYADEALFAARIHPLKGANTLVAEELQSLCYCIREILSSAIGNKGASVDTYVRPDGQLGTAQFDFKVAHRAGKLCPNCHTPIQRIMVRKRGSYFCPNCQPLTSPISSATR